jgi:hypothetical protein
MEKIVPFDSKCVAMCLRRKRVEVSEFTSPTPSLSAKPRLHLRKNIRQNFLFAPTTQPEPPGAKGKSQLA